MYDLEFLRARYSAPRYFFFFFIKSYRCFSNTAVRICSLTVPQFTPTAKADELSKIIYSPISLLQTNKMYIIDQKISCMTEGTKQRSDGSYLLNIKADNTNGKGERRARPSG